MNNKKFIILNQIKKIKVVLEKEYKTDLKARMAKSTINKILSEIYRTLDLIDNNTICLSDKNDIVKLRDLILNSKKKDGNPYKISTKNSKLKLNSKIFIELSSYKGIKRIINVDYIKKYMVLPDKERRNLQSYRSMLNEPPSPAEFEKLMNLNSSNDEFEHLMLKNLLIVLCCGALRNTAARTLKISSIKFQKDLVKIEQFPSDGVETKYDKNIVSYVLFSKRKYRNVLEQHIEGLRLLGFSDNDPLFPVRKVSFQDGQRVLVPTKEFSSRNNYLNKILKKYCESAKLKRVYTVHSCRHYFAKNIKPYLNSAREIEACAKSMGHNGVKLLIDTYGRLSDQEVENNMRTIQSRIYNGNNISLIENVSLLEDYFKNDATIVGLLKLIRDKISYLH